MSGIRAESIGIDVGATTTKVVAADAETVLDHAVIPTDTGRPFGSLLARVRVTAEARGWQSGALQAAGIAVAGLVEQGSLVKGLNLPGWDNVPVAALGEQAFGVPTTAMMDSEAAAHAEYRAGGHGAGRDLFVFTLGTGVGTAVVVDGAVRAGGGGLMLFPTEAAHPDASTSTIPAGLVWLEHLAGGPAIAAAAGVDDARQAAQAAARGDPAAAQAYRRAGSYLGWAAANVAHLLLVDRVVLAGGVSQAGAVLLDPAREAFRADLAPGLEARCDLALSRLGDLGGALGAALAAAKC